TVAVVIKDCPSEKVILVVLFFNALISCTNSMLIQILSSERSEWVENRKIEITGESKMGGLLLMLVIRAVSVRSD
ncbi:hypothetical protein NL518_30385, partial [Klebsiella pneumoniae]|nr:hypothetical protein [Klebsiella pneumoniae]